MSRARVTDVRPVRIAPATVSLAQVRELRTRPDVREVRALARVGEDRYRVEVRYIDPPARRRRRLPFRFEGVARYLRIMAVVFGVPAGLFGVGWLVWVLFGAAIAAAVKLIVTVLGVALAVVLAVWLLSAKAGVCPGLHCPGCPHK